MEADSQKTLARLIRSKQTAALGTLKDGAPLVSMVLYCAAPDFSAFHIHISRLAFHTQCLLKDPRVSLMIGEMDSGAADPQNQPRVSIQGEAIEIPKLTNEYEIAKTGYLKKFPLAAAAFDLADFSLYGIAPRTARYVAGFGKIFNLGLNDFIAASKCA
jgi:putative heme iron utilization protein